MSTAVEAHDHIAGPVSAMEAIGNFETSLLTLIEDHGLPTDGVLVGLDERADLLKNVTSGLRRLDKPDRSQSLYLSKMVAAAASGLFDAALNYLWNETIAELRRRVARYDLNFFFDVAVKHQDKRKEFKSEEDLQLLQDFDLLAACLSIGLLTDIGHRKLNHIRDMRNHSSAAHPNHTEISGLELAAYLRQCIDHVIVLELPSGTVEIKALMSRIRGSVFTPDQAAAGTAIFFSELPTSQAEALSKGLFGLNLDPNCVQTTRDNVQLLWPPIWNELPGDARFAFGTRIATFVANGDHDNAERARALFDLGEGAGAFLPESVRVPEVDDAIEQLRGARRAGITSEMSMVRPAGWRTS